jgi:translation initiation factor 2B subunit (eIF-2B alpha/beta/delta family)
VDVFHRALSGDGQLAVAVAAIKALTSVIENSKATTMMGLEIELSRAADALRRCNPTSISLSAGCELFMRCGRGFHCTAHAACCVGANWRGSAAAGM